jgi:prepilin-type N-terminal cleavage/methylation domain-containing protein
MGWRPKGETPIPLPFVSDPERSLTRGVKGGGEGLFLFQKAKVIGNMNKKGITLIELIVVMVIIGIMAVLTVPNIGRQLQRYRLKTAAREISNHLLETRTEAIKNADFANPVVYRVVFDSTLGTYTRQKYQSGSWANDGPAKTLPTNITIAKMDPTDINTRYFRTDGSSVRDTNTDPIDDQFDDAPQTLRIQLQNTRGDHYQVNLYSLTGMTEAQEGWN